MLHKVRCSNCGASLKVAQSHLGTKVLCPSCQSIVVPEVPEGAGREDEPGDATGAGPLHYHRPKSRRLVVSSAFGFLLIVVVATVAGWYSIHMSRQHFLCRYVFDPARETLDHLVDAVESSDGFSLNDFFAENVDEAKRQALLSTAASLRDVELQRTWRINWNHFDPEDTRETFELEQLITDKETGAPQVITIQVERIDGKFQVADLKVETPPAEEE